MSVNIDRLLENYFPFETIHEGEPDWKKVNPLASDEQQEQRANGNQNDNGQITPEALAKQTRRYRRITGSLLGGDRDKFTALTKRANRVRHSLQAQNLAGLLGPLTAFRTEVINRSSGRVK